jgi:hypothetical protein
MSKSTSPNAESVKALEHLSDKYGHIEVSIPFDVLMQAYLVAADNEDYLNSKAGEEFANSLVEPILKEILESADIESISLIMMAFASELM